MPEAESAELAEEFGVLAVLGVTDADEDAWCA